MATDWFCRIMGEEWGPMSGRELVAVARFGRLTRDDVVRRGATGTWVRAEIVDGLYDAPAPASTVTSHRVAIARRAATPAKRSLGKIRATRYWFHDGKNMVGPFTSQKLRKLAAAGILMPDDLVRSDRSPWVRAAQVNGLEFWDPSPLTPTVDSRPAVRSQDRRSPPPPSSNGHAAVEAYAEIGGLVLCETGR